MRPTLQSTAWNQGPQALAQRFADEQGAILLESARFHAQRGRYSFVARKPFQVFQSWGSRCELTHSKGQQVLYGNPWRILDSLVARCELLDELDFPFPLGGCFGYWGYDLKNFVEPRLTRRALNDLEMPDCWVGFYDSLVVFDHELQQAWIVSTGVDVDGSRSDERAREATLDWMRALGEPSIPTLHTEPDAKSGSPTLPTLSSSFSRGEFLEAVTRSQRYIQSGDIYQVNLAQRLSLKERLEPWDLYRELAAHSPAPYAAFLNLGDFSLCSSSPELFLRMSGSHVVTRPIKGTRPRSSDPTRDAQLSYELQTSPKEMAELVMITDLLRNDLGRVCEYGTIQVPELMQLERFAQVQHLVSTVEGRLRSNITHLEAFGQCFPGGSITGAPKIRAMEIIEELEPVTRGPYTGALGYLGFNRESQLSISIRTAICRPEATHFYVGAGIVSDSSPEAEYDETLAKAAGFQVALQALLRGRPISFPARAD